MIGERGDAAPPNAGPDRNRWWRHGLLINVLALVVLIAAIVRWVDLRGVWEGVAGLPTFAVVAALAVALICRLLMGLKWRQLIQAAGGEVTLGSAVSAYFQSVFSGRLVPIGVGGEVLRAWLLARRGVSYGILGGSMAAEKVIAFTSTAMLAAAGLLYLLARLPGPSRGPLALVIALGVLLGALVLALLLHAPTHERGATLLSRRLPPRARRLLGKASEALLGYRRKPSVLATNMLLAALEQSLQVMKLFIIGRGVGIDIPLVPFVAALMVVLFVRRLAGYLEGWGLAEGMSILTLTALGVSAELAVSLAFTNYAVSTIASLPGAYLLWRSGLGWRGSRRSGITPAPPGVGGARSS